MVQPSPSKERNSSQRRFPLYVPVLLACLACGWLGYHSGASRQPDPVGVSTNGLPSHMLHQQATQTLARDTVDVSKRYTVSFEHGDVMPGQPAPYRFRIYDASNGSPSPILLKLYDKISHLVIVDSALNYYSHIHPEIDVETGDLVAETVLPASGSYRFYLNYQPFGAIEQQVGFSLNVDATQAVSATQPVDSATTKFFDGYQVTISGLSFSASQLSSGKQAVTLTAKDPAGKSVTNLRPYLGAFGHLVMINAKTYDYIHVHPANAQPPSADASGGPTVEFLPLGLYGPIKPGTYRVFAQLNPDNKLILADFTIDIQ